MIVECIRSMKLHGRLSNQFWADALNTIVYLINHGSSIPLDGGVREKEWNGKKVYISFKSV